MAEFLSQNDEGVTIELPAFYRLVYPYQDFLLVFGREDQPRGHSGTLTNLSEETGLIRHALEMADGNSCALFSSLPMGLHKGTQYAFSGTARTGERLIFGQNDIASDATLDPQTLEESIGNHFLIYQQDNDIHINTDYFGISKVFYFKSDDLFLASNRYHLLLLALSSLEIKMKTDWSKVYAELYRMGIFSSQVLAHEMSVLNTFMMPVDKKIVLNEGGVTFENTSLYDTVRNPEKYSPERYGELLNKARNELVDNARVALESPHFERVICDLTGGLDSRTSYAAIVNLPEHRDRVAINSFPSPWNPRDFELALEVNGVHRYLYDDSLVETERYFARDLHAELDSYYFGTYSLYSGQTWSKNRKRNLISLRGSYGGACAGLIPTTRDLAGTEIDGMELPDFVDTLAKVGISSPGLEDFFKREFYKAFQQTPGRTPLEKLELHYLFFRNGLHFNGQYAADAHTPDWGLLQSKTLFKLKLMTFHEFKSCRLQLEITALLDDKVAAVPYELELNNREREALLLKGILKTPLDESSPIHDSSAKDLWEQAEERRKHVVVNEDADDKLEEMQRHYKDYPDELHGKAMQALRVILKHNQELRSLAGFSLLKYLQESKGDSSDKRQKIVNRLCTLYYQLKLTGELDDDKC